MRSFSFTLLLLAIPALALPNLRKFGGCDLSNAKMPLPAHQTAMTVPTIAPSFVGLGVGVQNYTCNATSLKYSSVGAVAELFDMSCLTNGPLSTTIQNTAFDIWNNAPSSFTTQDIIKMLCHDAIVLGQHYFVPNPNPAPGSPALSPKWDFTSDSEKGNAQAFVIGAKVGDLPAPSGTADVDWLQLKNVEGQLADSIYRVESKGGQPPASCTAGSPPLTVKYTSQYWLFGGTIKQ